MYPPPQSVLGLAAVVVLAVIAILALSRVRWLPVSGRIRTALAVLIALFVGGIVGWFVAKLPEYWD